MLTSMELLELKSFAYFF